MHHEDSEDSTADKSTPETVDPSPHVPVTPVLGKGARWIEVAWPKEGVSRSMRDPASKHKVRAGEMAPILRVYTTLIEDWSSPHSC